jgi:hypothetical protein
MAHMKIQILPAYFLLIGLVVSSLPGYAQGIKIAKGESSIRIETTMSQVEAEAKAVELAKVDALITAFGEYIEQQSDLELVSGRVDFRSYGQTKVKGEWIRNVGEPVFKYYEKPGKGSPERWISCVIKGEIRKVLPKADLDVRVISCERKECETEKFSDGQDIYLYVKSPISGYLTVFLDDGNRVYRLLPYRDDVNQKSFPIQADKEYVLFSKAINSSQQKVDALKVFTDRELEVNTFVIAFSEHEFGKPRLEGEKTDDKSYIIPRSLSHKYFEDWLGENRAAFTDFLDLRRRFTIASK